MPDERDNRIPRRLTAREMLAVVLETECSDMPDDVKDTLLNLADRPAANRGTRFRDLLRGGSR